LLILAGAQVSGDAWIGPDAVLGAGVRVDAGAQVQRAACWDATHIGPGERVVDQLAAPGVRLDC
jgi:NDP-sugar pyrophosphorylase family protein